MDDIKKKKDKRKEERTSKKKLYLNRSAPLEQSLFCRYVFSPRPIVVLLLLFLLQTVGTIHNK
jgi:hypothetical protein